MNTRLRLLSSFLALLASCAATTHTAVTTPVAPTKAVDDRIHVVVLHTNDVHGQVLPRKATWLKRDPAPMVGGLPRAGAMVRELRVKAEAAGAVVFVVDSGDWYQGTPEGLLDDGAGFARALALVGYDAMCVGNHDFDHGVPNLVNILKETHVPAVAANLDEKATGKPVDWVVPWRIVERGGLRVAFVGLVTPITPEITHPDAQKIEFVDPAKALTRAQEQLKGKADWIVPLTHLGVDGDKELATAHPELGLIVGGHSHTFLRNGERAGTTLIVQSGSKVSAVGRVDLWLDRETKRVVESKSTLIDLDEEPKPEFVNKPLEDVCKTLVTRTEERMKQPLGELTAAATTPGKGELVSSTMGNLVTDALRAHARSDVAIMNRGGIRAGMQAGTVTRRDVFEVMPFDNNVTVLKMTGAEVEQMVRNAVEGKAHSGIEVSGIVIEYSLVGDAKKLGRVSMGGAPLDPTRVYRVAMNSFMADGGDAYIAKVAPGDKRTDDVALIRDVLEELFVNRGKVTPATDNRYVVTKP